MSHPRLLNHTAPPASSGTALDNLRTVAPARDHPALGSARTQSRRYLHPAGSDRVGRLRAEGLLGQPHLRRAPQSLRQRACTALQLVLLPLAERVEEIQPTPPLDLIDGGEVRAVLDVPGRLLLEDEGGHFRGGPFSDRKNLPIATRHLVSLVGAREAAVPRELAVGCRPAEGLFCLD